MPRQGRYTDDGRLDVAGMIAKMRLVRIRTEEVTPYARNPRRNDGAVEAVAESIRRFGFHDPIVVRGPRNEIVNGHTRWKAARLLGLEFVPCLRGDHLTDAEARAFRLADNKTHELSAWDDGLLEIEIADLPEFDLQAFGFDPPVADGESLRFDGLDGNGETATPDHVLRCGQIYIPMTDEEFAAFKRRVDDYADANGVTVGFVADLLGLDGEGEGAG